MVFPFPSFMPSTSSIFSTYASFTASIMLIQTIINQFVPTRVQNYLLEKIHFFFKTKQNKSSIIIDELEGINSNELYYEATTYLRTKIVRRDMEPLRLVKLLNDKNITVNFSPGQTIVDTFDGIELQWRYMCEEREKTSKHVDDYDKHRNFFQLSFEKSCKDKVVDDYIKFVRERAMAINQANKVVKLHTLNSVHGGWDRISLEHPSTFETLAMEADKKKRIMDDLDKFVTRKEFYKQVGRAWKRGYLLYGPPGTGKSSLIAAIANYLKFDIYDLELTNIKRDSDLRKLTLRTASRSILVIEDIDCTVDLPDRRNVVKTDSPSDHIRGDQKFTLSGLLNFIDGLWSCCVNERIIIFTTNHKEKLDPALLRAGRMDVHIHMSYLTGEGFRVLASTYLNVKGNHKLFREIEELINEMNVSPAEVAEELMHGDDADSSLESLLLFLKSKTKEMTTLLVESSKDLEIKGKDDEKKLPKEEIHEEESDVIMLID